MRALLGLLLLAAVVRPASADIYTWTDDKGVVHFTNIKPKGKSAKKAKKWDTVASKKAAAPRGDCPRCDKVPSRDNSKERFTRYDEYIREASELYQIPEPLIRAVIKAESDYDPRVVSAMDARGLMQLMPEVCEDMHVPMDQVFEPRINILGGTRLLRILANRFNGDLVMTIAGYHAGGSAVAKYNGIPPYEHTQKYVRIVLKHYYKYKEQAAGR